MLKLQAIGHIGKDCVTKNVNGKNVINFSIAHTVKRKDANGNIIEDTTWISCSYWTDSTAIASYLKKGQMVYVEGFPSVDWYDSKTAKGIIGQQLLRVAKIELVGNKRSDGSSSNDTRSQPGAQASNSDSWESTHGIGAADDLPF